MKKIIGVTVSIFVVAGTALLFFHGVKGREKDADDSQPVVVTAAAGGWSHSLALKADRTVLAWGGNEYGQLGDGTATARSGPVTVRDLADVIAVSAGMDHSIALRAEGSVWAWGANDSGQLGDGTTTARASPVRVAGLSGVMAVSGGGEHSVALKRDGTVWAWGGNEYGQLGDGTKTNRTAPVQAKGLYGVLAVAAGRDFTVAISGDGTVWAWGANDFGQLGDGTTDGRSSPVEVKGVSDVVAVACGYEHTIALKKDGTVWAWGNNKSGQLGDGTTISRLTPVQVQGIAEVSAVSAGRAHSVALQRDGTVLAWGANDQNQVGTSGADRPLPAEVEGMSGNTTVVASGGYHVLAIMRDYTIRAWGWNKYGQLGDRTTVNSSAPVLALLREHGNKGPGKDLDKTVVSANADVVSIAGGGDHALALMSDGTVWAWGSNFNGQLGDGTRRTMRSSPAPVDGLKDVIAVAAGRRHSMALKKDGTVWTWGSNEFSQLGDGTAVTSRALPVRVQGLSGVTAIACGRFFSLALKKDGTVWAWGKNEAGLWGDINAKDRNAPYQVTALADVTAVSARANHVLVLKKDGTVTAIGSDMMGQLGDGMTSNVFGIAHVQGLSDVIAVAVGQNVSFALRKDGTVWGWGFVGVSNARDPQVFISEAARTVPVQMGGITDAVALSAGESHAMALKKDGALWAWGANKQNQLGVVALSAPSVSMQEWHRVTMLSDVTAVFCGDCFTVALKKDKTLWSWGYNEFGELGAGTAGRPDFGKRPYNTKELGKIAAVRVKDFTRIQQEDVRSTSTPTVTVIGIAAGSAHSLAIKSDGTLWAWGMNDFGQIANRKVIDVYAGNARPGLVSSLQDIAAATGGVYNTVVLKTDGTVFEMGRTLDNLLYEMKIGGMSEFDMFRNYGRKLTMDSRAAPPKMNSPAPVGDLTDVVSVENGGGFSIAVKNDGTVWAWGVNTSGQLGDGTTTNRNVPVQVRGLKDITAVAAGDQYALALGRDGAVWAWGAIMKPKMPTKHTMEEYARERQKTLQTTPIMVNGLSDASSLAAGESPLALKNDGTVWTCWDWNRNQREAMVPSQIAGLDGVAAIASKGGHAVALKRSGSVWSWGGNRYGQLGNGTKVDSASPVEVEELTDVIAIAAGAGHTLALKRDGTVWAWGNNDQGQLGDGTNVESAFPIRIEGL